jgi:hypothetical protein
MKPVRYQQAARIGRVDRPSRAPYAPIVLRKWLVCGFATYLVAAAHGNVRAADELIESIEVSNPSAAADDDTYWMQARPAVIPGESNPQAVITLQRTDRVGTHMYHGLAAMWSSDLGKTWSMPEPLKTVDRIVRADGLMEAPVDMTPQWHAQTGKLLVTGATFWQDPKIRRNIPRGPSDTAYTVYDARAKEWSQWRKLNKPHGPKFFFSRAGCTQRVDLPNGDILLPIYFYNKTPGERNYVAVARCTFDGETLTYKEHGSELTVDLDAMRDRTGLYEPSLTFFGGKYLLTLRADEGAYAATSDDGLNYSQPKPWRFDDGELLGSYNTQQHWVTHSDSLYLSYTRRGADNDDIMRHRAPLFIARVDPETLAVERATEKILLPNLGRAFGNFGVCNVTPRETWVVDCLVGAKPGVANVYLARIRWSRPNRLVSPSVRRAMEQ